VRTLTTAGGFPEESNRVLASDLTVELPGEHAESVKNAIGRAGMPVTNGTRRESCTRGN
jgi:hypothetical protein